MPRRMSLLRACFLAAFAVVLLAPPCILGAATEEGAFKAAARAFQDRAYPRAEVEFGAFIQRFTNSARIPEAVLFQAEARILQTNYAGAIELLSSRLPQAGSWADAFQFWLAEAHLRNGDYQQASEQFAGLLARFPTSARRIEAALGEVTARSRLGQWGRVIELLQQTNGYFQIAARANPTNDLALRGYLLLAEAHLERNQPAAAEETLQLLANLPLAPRLAWHRQFLACRIQVAKGNLEQALPGVTNLLTLATNAADTSFLAESFALQGALLERLKRLDEAMLAYECNLADGFPVERQREALLKIASLALARNRLGDATRVLERFCAQDRNAPSREQALLTLGELRLRQHLQARGSPESADGTNSLPSTNFLPLAQTALDTLIREYPASKSIGKAWLNLGWCHWLRDNLEPAREAFAKAVETLPKSFDQALAMFKLGDTQFRLNAHSQAITNYGTLLGRYEDDSAVREELFEPALYQIVRAGIAGDDLTAASDALGKILQLFPTSFHTERAVLLAGQTLTKKGNPAAARAIYLKFAERAPEAPLLPEVRLAIARTYEEEGAWEHVIREYDLWLERFKDSPALPRAEYLRAWANFQSGRETNAFVLFTNFVARFPQDERTPLALWWVADYHSRKGNHIEAEQNYQLLYLSTNWPRSELSYQAQIMAGRTALARQGWTDAMRYFTNLTSDAKCPPDIWAQATLAYGNLLMQQVSSNKVEDYRLAARVYEDIVERFPTNPVAVLAIGEKASCLLQWGAAQNPAQYDPAATEFQKLITNRLADATVRATARVGLATVLKAQAQQKTGPDQQQLLKRALDTYLDVVYFEKDLQENERPPDPYWLKRATLEAAELAERLQDWPYAVKLYEGLLDLLPPMRPVLEKKLARAQANLARPKL